MCGIWAVFGLPKKLTYHCASSFQNIANRGPDTWRIEHDSRIKNCYIGYHRLTVVDCKTGMQPMQLYQYPLNLLICNGELYNCKKVNMNNNLNNTIDFHFPGCAKQLDGVFAFCIVDINNRKVYMARDPYGVRPLFRLHTKTGILAISSEAKGLVTMLEDFKDQDAHIEPFPPGTFAEYNLLEDGTTELIAQQLFHSPGDRSQFTPFVPYEDLAPAEYSENIRKLFKAAVRKRLIADRRIGCLLSGGLDSSLTAAVLVNVAKEINLPYKIQTFTIGMEGSPDLKAAKIVADYIGTEHHEIIFTEKDVEDAVEEVIYVLETPDITTVRDSLCMYLTARYIKKNTDTTVIFSGEGSDELAQGYIYFKKAPNAEAAYNDSIRLLRELYLFDGLRADRTVSSQGLELRVPFLDLQFTNYYLNMPKKLLQPKDGTQEKYMVRSAFAGQKTLPDSILWRHKEAFSDGVTSRKRSLFHILEEIAEKKIGKPFNKAEAEEKYPDCTPISTEALYYREVFERKYPGCCKAFAPFFWMPQWCEGVSDPSARFLNHYAAETETAV